MLQLNGNDYKLLLMDTNILSNVTKNIDGVGSSFLNKFALEEKCVMCFTPENIFELQKANVAYESFKVFFSVVPCMLMTTHKGIRDQEIDSYITGNPIDPFITGLCLSNNALSFRDIIDFFESNLELTNILESESTCRFEVLASWQNQRKIFTDFVNKNNIGFRVKNEMLNKIYKNEIQKTLIKDIKIFNPSFNSSNVDLDSFPAIHLSEYCHFEKVYRSNKPLGINDISDIIISSSVPYCDIVITENFQASLFKQAKKFIKQLSNLEIYTLRDV